jgi:hypothetical protein
LEDTVVIAPRLASSAVTCHDTRFLSVVPLYFRLGFGLGATHAGVAHAKTPEKPVLAKLEKKAKV